MPDDPSVQMADLIDKVMESRPYVPIRRWSAKGQPPPFSQFTRRCARCSACFLALNTGTTGERGIWREWHWYCSQECYELSTGTSLDDLLSDHEKRMRASQSAPYEEVEHD